jgi:hypothetical protein
MMTFRNYQMKNGMLTTDFGDKEVSEAISHMEHNKTSWPDEVPAEIYRCFRMLSNLILWLCFHKCNM